MNERTGKTLLAVGGALAVGSLLLAFTNGTYFRYHSGADGSGFDFKLGTQNTVASWWLGGLAIVALVGGAIILAQAVSSEPAPPRLNESGEPSAKPQVFTMLRRLTLSAKDCQLAGVCGGLGEYTPIPTWIWRVLFLILFFCFGTGVIFYLILWIALPNASEDKTESD